MIFAFVLTAVIPLMLLAVGTTLLLWGLRYAFLSDAALGAAIIAIGAYFLDMGMIL